MKTNETPEKIYLERVPCTDVVYDNWKPQKTISDDIEYIRTDAFIKKACDYLQKNLWRTVLEEGKFRQRFVTDFEIYMKGE